MPDHLPSHNFTNPTYEPTNQPTYQSPDQPAHVSVRVPVHSCWRAFRFWFHIAEWFKLFPKRNFKVFSLEEYQQAPDQTAQELAEFVGLSDGQLQRFVAKLHFHLLLSTFTVGDGGGRGGLNVIWYLIHLL
jgi:hypothetical protein